MQGKKEKNRNKNRDFIFKVRTLPPETGDGQFVFGKSTKRLLFMPEQLITLYWHQLPDV